MSERLWGWYPPVGVFIAGLALRGVLVPLFRDLTKIRRGERAIWTSVIFLLMLLEVRSIYRDRSVHDREQALARAEQLAQFEGIGRLDSAISQNQAHFDTTMSGMRRLLESTGEISRRSLASIHAITGGGSFCYLTMYDRKSDAGTFALLQTSE